MITSGTFIFEFCLSKLSSFIKYCPIILAVDDIGSGALVLIKQLKNKSLCFQDMVFLSLVQRVRLSIWYRELNLNGVKFPLSLRTNNEKKAFLTSH